jgi:succinate dehydrogenase/fumarate reductase flavoprotein subunit
MTITYALMEKLEEIATKSPETAKIITKARVTKLHTENGAVVGVEYEKDGQTVSEHGPVIIATGGYGADFSDDSLLKKYRPDLLYLPTTNGDHCTGDGIKLALDVGANPADLEWVQVHPTGLVDPNEPDAKLKVFCLSIFFLSISLAIFRGYLQVLLIKISLVLGC